MATTTTGPVTAAAGRMTAPAIAIPAAMATVTASTAVPAPSRARGGVGSVIPVPATRIAAAERTPEKGNHH